MTAPVPPNDDLKQSLDDVTSQLQSLNQSISAMVSSMNQQTGNMATLSSALDALQNKVGALTGPSMLSADALTKNFSSEATKILEEARKKNVSVDKSLLDGVTSAVNTARDNYMKARKDLQAEIAKGTPLASLTKEISAVQEKEEELAESLKAYREVISGVNEELSKTEKIRVAQESFYRGMLNSLTNLVSTIYDSAQQIRRTLSVDFATGVDRTIRRIVGEYTTAIGTLFGRGPMVSREEREQAAVGFRDTFGTILRKDLEESLGREAKQRNIFADDLIRGSRAVIALSGTFEMAKNAFLISSRTFNQVGMSTKEAADFAVQNQELLARAGRSATDEIFRLGAQAKQAGYNLGTIEKFSDDLAWDFSFALDKVNELGALGINIPIAELVQASLSGDRSQMVNLLQNSMGNLENLTRVQQTGISRFLGMSFDEVLRMQKGGTIQGSITQSADVQAAQQMTEAAKIMESGSKIFMSAVQLFGTLLALQKGASLAGMNGMANIAGILARLSVAVGGLAATFGIGGYVSQQAKERSMLGTGLGILGTTASMAATGAVVGGGLPGAVIGGLAGLGYGIYKASSSWGDDVVARPGYGTRSLVTPTSIIQLNNKDTVVSYADDMASDISGVSKFKKGAIVNELAKTPQPSQIKLDTKPLEDKIDSLKSGLDRLASTPVVVNLDGRKVGTILRENLRATDNLATTKGFDYGS
jgi:hypothetical protein